MLIKVFSAIVQKRRQRLADLLDTDKRNILFQCDGRYLTSLRIQLFIIIFSAYLIYCHIRTLPDPITLQSYLICFFNFVMMTALILICFRPRACRIRIESDCIVILFKRSGFQFPIKHITYAKVKYRSICLNISGRIILLKIDKREEFLRELKSIMT